MRLLTLRSFVSLACLLSFAPSSRAGTNLVSTTVVGGNTGWFTSAMWKTNDGNGNGVGTAVTGPVTGNTYTLMPNGTAIGNNLAETRVRNLYTNGTPTTLWTFPGDSLELRTNTEIRFKQIATPATIETVNFPGVAGNPGLILNGGMLNVGDAIIQPIAGLIQAAPGTESYICPGNNDGASVDNARGFTFQANIAGSGRLVIFEAGITNPQRISSANNTYSGTWVVKAGWLLGAGTASLGTNSSFEINPNYVLPVPPFSSTTPVVDVAGPAILEPNYDLNSAGTLSLLNGGRMRLHQNCAFTAVNIQGTPLSSGTHYYSELAANFPTTFDAGGSGAITVQPYGSLPALGPIVITPPRPQVLFAGRTGHFSVVASANGAPPLTYQWRKNGGNLTDGGNISGSATSTLFISGVGASDIASYDVVVGNTAGTVTSSAAPLSLTGLSGETYENTVMAANPFAFYELNESGDPATNTPAYDYAGGYNGTYGAAVFNGFNGVPGPDSTAGFPGFASGNKAAQFANLVANDRISVGPWNLRTNTVTITSWVLPGGPQNPNNALVFCRGGGSATVAGLCYGATLDISGNAQLGYNWNGEPDTYNWSTGLVPPAGQWSFVALVVTPTNATIHLMNTNGLSSATHTYNHVVQGFDGTTLIGDDSFVATGARAFGGNIDDVAIFNRALSQTELINLFTNASGATAYPPVISLQPVSQSLYAGQTAQFRVTGGGSEPVTYQWQSGPSGGPYANLGNGGRISGADTPNLTINNIAAADQLDYLVVLSNGSGSVTSSVATLTVNATSAGGNITMSAQQATGVDWDNGLDWSDGNPASVSAAAFPGSTYEILAGARLRTPLNPTVATFPGSLLTVDGDGVWNLNPAAGATIGEIRFKQPTYGAVNGTVIFNKLVMNGGQLDVGNDGVLILGGELNIQANTPINNDNTTDRGYRIDALLSGSGNIEYHGYNQLWQSNFANNLNIAGTSNTFSGKWNVVTGTLLGTGPNSLGTNDITVGPNGALETTYNINNTNATLFLNGRMYLHQNDAFKTVIINGSPLAVGAYTFAQLHGSYPNVFPSAWMPQNGATNFTAGSGSISVTVTPAPSVGTQPTNQTLYAGQTAQFIAGPIGTPPLTYQWYKNGGVMADGGNVTGSTTPTLTITNIFAADAGSYVFVVSNAYGSATSSVASLTVLPMTILSQPVSVSAYPNQAATFNVGAVGNTPLFYQWRKNGVNLTDSGAVSGSTTSNLTISPVAAGNAGSYDVVVTNTVGSLTSVATTLTVLAPATNLTLDYGGAPIVQVAGLDWDSPTNWSDGYPASQSAFYNPGAHYEVVTGARLRSPVSGVNSVFPGDVLTLDGSGVLVNNNDATIGEIRFKHADPGTVFFKKLVMNGGQLDNGDNGLLILTGQMDIRSNAPIYVDSAANQDRSYRIDSWLTGTGNIEWDQFGPALTTNSLNITGTSNTYSGTWHVVQGALLGSGQGSLGPGNITVDAFGALETLYDINNPNGNLMLDPSAQVFLHQNDRFATVTIGGTPLSVGTHSFAELSANYSANFPSAWTSIRGSTFSSGSGSITVLGAAPPPVTINFSVSGGNLTLTWSQGTLLEATNVSGPWVTNGAASPYTVAPTGPQRFFRVQTQ